MKTKSGKSIAPIGIGTWNVSSLYKPENGHTKYRGTEPSYGSEEQDIAAIQYSISLGQNHIDCAEMYGAFYTDEVVGRAIRDMNREDLFIADKLWKTSVEKGKVRATVERMLKKLGTDYIDLLYIHAPWKDVPWEEAIPQIDELIDEGLVRYFGVSNFTIDDMQKASKISKHPIAANQMNFNVLYKAEVDKNFKDYCETHRIQIVAYQPIKRKEVLDNPTIRAIAKNHNATEAQVAIAWLLAQQTLPIPKANKKAHIDDNLGALELTLDAKELATLDQL